jgi:hypothetical protein
VEALRRRVGGDEGYDPGKATRAGAAGALAYLAEMAVDLPLLDCPTNDLMLLGRPFTANRRVWPLLGAALHVGNGIALAQVYGLFGRRLPGLPWLRGILFTLLENALLWGLVPVFDRVHPAIRAGELPRMNRPIPLLQQILRHIAYGAALGVVYGDGRGK